MFEKINFEPGKVTFNAFNFDPKLPLDKENPHLDEDMMQIEYPQDITLDVGWYYRAKEFRVCIIKDYDWEKPVIIIDCITLEEVERALQVCVNEIKKMLDDQSTISKVL
jgi:hypothetical protein